jgi:hypothetical protein
MNNNPYVFRNTKIDDNLKAKIFTFDAKVFLRSLNDAVVCTKQIANINCSKELYLDKISILDKTMKKRTLLLAKYCDHDICNVNIIASSSMNSYYNYFLLKFSVNLYLNFMEGLNQADDFYKLSKELDLIHQTLNNDLKFFVGHTKRKYFIITRDENGKLQTM